MAMFANHWMTSPFNSVIWPKVFMIYMKTIPELLNVMCNISMHSLCNIINCFMWPTWMNTQWDNNPASGRANSIKLFLLLFRHLKVLKRVRKHSVLLGTVFTNNASFHTEAPVIYYKVCRQQTLTTHSHVENCQWHTDV